MYDIDKKIFQENLLLTQTYCELQLENTQKDNASILRSFNPKYNGKHLFEYNSKDYLMTEWTVHPLERTNKYLYNELFQNQLIHKINSISTNANISFKGQILVTEMDETVVDGASEAQSEGLIDGYDLPPIDTWFYITQNKKGRILFAWIPQQFVNLATKAIDVNCVDCISWFDESYTKGLKKILFEIKNAFK